MHGGGPGKQGAGGADGGAGGAGGNGGGGRMDRGPAVATPARTGSDRADPATVVPALLPPAGEELRALRGDDQLSGLVFQDRRTLAIGRHRGPCRPVPAVGVLVGARWVVVAGGPGREPDAPAPVGGGAGGGADRVGGAAGAVLPAAVADRRAAGGGLLGERGRAGAHAPGLDDRHLPRGDDRDRRLRDLGIGLWRGCRVSSRRDGGALD